VFSKKLIVTEMPNKILLHYLKCCCDSLNKLITNLLSSTQGNTREVKSLFNLYDHCMVKWADQLNLHMNNTNKHKIEVYLRHILLMTISKLIYYYRLGFYGYSIKLTIIVEPIYREMKLSSNPQTQHICGRYKAIIASLYLNHSLNKKAKESFNESLIHFHNEHKLLNKVYINLHAACKDLHKAYRINENVFVIANNR